MQELHLHEDSRPPQDGVAPASRSATTATGSDADLEFLSVVSHELKGPLTNISGYTQLLMRQAQLSEDRRSAYLKVILDETRRLSRLVNDLVDACQFERGRFDLVRSPIRLDLLMEAAIERARRLVPTGEIEIAPHPPITGHWDGARIEDLLFHLIWNSWRHGQSDVPTLVTAEPRDGVLAIGVLDRGPGIPDHVRPLVGTPFYRVPRDGGGRKVKGLGLYLSRSLAEAHGGSLGLEPRPGGGTIARVLLPIFPA